ncbi:MAG: EpsG family protein [Bacteroidota bacterium]
MILYFALYLFMFLIALLNYNRLYILLVYFILFLLLAFKGEVGCDYTGYLNRYIYFYPGETFISLRGEVGWWYIERFIYNQDMDYQWYYIFSGFLAVFFCLLAQKHVKSIGLIILIYPIVFLQLGLSGIRQFVAVSIVLYIVARYVFDLPKSIRPYIVWILVAATFHVSALIMLLFLPFLTKLNPWLIALLVIVGLIGFSSSFYETVSQVYQDRYFNETPRTSSGAWVRFMLTIILLALGVYTPGNIYLKLGIAIVVIGVITGLINSIALHRLNYYFLPVASILVLKRALTEVKGLISLRLAYLATFAYMIFWFTFSTHSHCILDYHFFFQRENLILLQ